MKRREFLRLLPQLIGAYILSLLEAIASIFKGEK